MAITDGITHLFQMTSAANESNVAPGGLAPLTLTASGSAPVLDPGPVAPGAKPFRSFPTDSQFMSGPSMELVIPPGAGPINHSIVAWFRVDNLNGADLGAPEKVLMMEGNGGSPPLRHFVLHFDGGGTDRVHVDVAQTNSTIVTADAVTFGALSVATWYMAVAVFDGDNSLLGISVNNSALDTVAWDGSMVDSGTTNLAIAFFNNFNSGELEGDISELVVYNRALTTQDISDSWNGGAGVDLLAAMGGSATVARLLLTRRRMR